MRAAPALVVILAWAAAVDERWAPRDDDGARWTSPLMADLPTAFEERLDLVEHFSQSLHRMRLPFPFNFCQIVPQHRSVFIFAGANERTEPQVLFVQFQTTQRLSAVGILHN